MWIFLYNGSYAVIYKYFIFSLCQKIVSGEMIKTVRWFFREPVHDIDDRSVSQITHQVHDASLASPALSRDEAVLARHRTMNPDGASKKLGRAARERRPNQWVIREKMTRN